MSAHKVDLMPLPRPDNGCDAPRCHDPRTVMLHPYHGRLCSDHATIPPGPFRRGLAADMVEMGRADAALAYLAGWLAQETGRRFDAALGRVVAS